MIEELQPKSDEERPPLIQKSVESKPEPPIPEKNAEI